MSYDNVPTVEVSQLPSPLSDELTVVDVREQTEWDHGHIPEAVHVPLMDVPARLGDLPAGRLLLVCKIGGRSAQATAYLQANGHDAVNLAGGMVEWSGAGLPMVSETGRDPRVV
jgi:rhodanese-related sulfurtransferase